MTTPARKHTGSKTPVALDLFCGAGGLTRGLLDAGIVVKAGVDIDTACKHAYEHNNRPAKYVERSVTELKGKDLAKYYEGHDVRILAGCAPCVTFSKYTQGAFRKSDPKWTLLKQFGRLVRELKPDVVSMENVVELQRHSVFEDFLSTLTAEGFHFEQDAALREVYCPDYGIPQERRRLVLLASRLGPIKIVPRTHGPSRYRNVAHVIADLPPLKAGDSSATDPLHRASRMSPLNLRRIQESVPGGTWRDWSSELVAECHKAASGRGYFAVYGRMEWERPSPTITTQFFGFGNGRFGHPEQDRGLSLREGAVLQTFPGDYQFVAPGGKYRMTTIGRMIGNAVPVRLGEIVGRSILKHLENHAA